MRLHWMKKVVDDMDKQKVLKWNDTRVNIKWPIKSKPIMSKRDE